MSATAQPTSSLTEASRLADQLERAHRGGAWHGPAFAEVLTGLGGMEAAERLIPGAHTAWEIVDHVSTWLDVCRRRIGGEPMHAVTDEEDWPAQSTGQSAAESEDAWRRDLATLEDRFGRLHAAVGGLDDAQLDEPVAGSDPTVRGLILGIIQHHAYHGGQITLLRKLGAAR